MIDIPELIQAYNDALSDVEAADTHELLVGALRRENLVFGDRLLCNVLRPQLLSEAEYAWICREVEIVTRALVKVAAARSERPDVDAALALTDLERQALEVQSAPAGPVPFARMDAFLDHTAFLDRGARDTVALRFVEFNGETPAGVGYEDILGRIFLDLPPVRRLATKVSLRVVEGADTIRETLESLVRAAGIAGPHAAAIVDWDDVPTRPEFEILARRFGEGGLPTQIGSPDELTFRDGRLRLRDTPVTIVYKRVLVSELLEAVGLDHPLIHALRSGAVVMANPFQCRPLHKKAAFAVLTDERFADLFTPDERWAIERHVPWTRRVEDRRTLNAGTEVDLLQWASENRERLVLKPNDDYGGRGIVLGWEASADEWHRALRAGLDKPTVIQERIATAHEDFPVWTETGLRIDRRLVDLDPYCYTGSRVHGVLTRLSPGALLNVTAGGGSVAPTFIVGAP